MAKKISIPSIHKRYEQADVKKHLYALDGISGLGSLVIMIFHFGLFASHLEGHPYPLSKLLAPIYQYGYLAVEFFFLMSGFVIEYSYSKKVKTYTFYQFLLKRIQRLYPLLMLTTILTGILQLIYYQMMGREYFFIHPITLWGAFLHFFGLQNAGLSVLTFNGPAWYVGILVLMYLLYYYSSINIHRIKIYGLFIIIGVHIYCGKYNLPFLNEAIARGCVSFFAGVLLCIYYKNRNPKQAFLLGGGGITVLLSSLFIYIYGETIIGNTILFFALAYFPLLLICILKSEIISVIFSSKPLIMLGELSYDIFLYHFPMQLVFVIFYNLHIFKGFHLYRIETLGLWIMSTILIAFISKKCVDKRIGCLFDYFLQVFDLKP